MIPLLSNAPPRRMPTCKGRLQGLLKVPRAGCALLCSMLPMRGWPNPLLREAPSRTMFRRCRSPPWLRKRLPEHPMMDNRRESRASRLRQPHLYLHMHAPAGSHGPSYMELGSDRHYGTCPVVVTHSESERCPPPGALPSCMGSTSGHQAYRPNSRPVAANSCGP